MRGRSVNNTRVIVEPNVLLYFLFTLFRLWKNAHFVPRSEKLALQDPANIDENQHISPETRAF
jgi:hypothetical protein